MYVQHVSLRDIRPFRELDFEFARPNLSGSATQEERFRGWNVVAGDNASGKSTLLRAIALAIVGPDIARALAPSLTGWIHRGASTASIQVTLAFDHRDKFRGGGQRPKEPFVAGLRLERQGAEVALSAAKTRLNAPRNGPWAPDQGAWFAAGYGPFRRLFGHSSEAARLMAVSGRPPRFGTLFREDATLSEATTWLQDLKFKALENHADEKQLLDEVKALLNDEFLQGGFALHDVNSDGLWLRDSGGLTLPITEMSDGYRSALALLIDIVRHMASVFGHAGLVVERGGRRVVPHPGVVLIDEVDSHLHPSWQRLIGGWLKSRFPAVQFITTSHSPFVVQATDPGGLYRLPSPSGDVPALRVPEDEREKLVRGTVDTVLTSDAFGLVATRSPEAVQERERYSRLRSKERQRLPLTPAESDALQQLSLFVHED